jgi:hypothetical protein
MSRKVIKDMNFFWFGERCQKFAEWTQFYVDRRILSILYGKILLAYSPYSLCIFSVHAKLVLAYLETTSFKQNHSRIVVTSVYAYCIMTFGVFSGYDNTLSAHSWNKHK